MIEKMSPEEIQEILDAYNHAIANNIPISKELANAMRDAQVGIRGYTAGLKTSLSQLGTSIGGLGKGMLDGKAGITAFNDSIDSTAKALEWLVSKIPFVGVALAGLIEAASKYEQAVTKQAQSLFDTYQDISRNGLATSMTDVFNNLQNMGYTMDEIGNMSKVLKENVRDLAGFGGTAAQGVQRLSQVSKAIQDSDVGTQFKNMGMSVNDINTGIASFIRVQQLNGVTSKQTTEKLTASAVAYIEQQDILTKLTGASAKEQEDIHRQAMQTQQYAAKTFLLQQAAAKGDAKANAELERNKKLEIEFATRYPEHQKGMLAALAGATNSPEYAEFQMAFPEMAADMRAGTKTVEEIMNTGNKDAQATLAKTAGYIAAGGKEYFGSVSDLMHGSAMTAEDQVKAVKDAIAQRENQRKGADTQTADMVKFLQAQRNVTQSMDRFVNAGISPTVWSLTKLAEASDAATNQFEKLFGKKPSGTQSGSQSGSYPGGVAKMPAGADQLIKKMSAAGITDKMAQANILAQVNAESGGVAKSEKLNYTPEQLLQKFPEQVKSLEQAQQVVSQGPEAVGNLIYGGRNGNKADEGYMYRGRGIIQLSGKNNYEHFGKLLGIDLVSKPDLANDPEIAQNIAIAYFKEKEKGENGKKGINLSSIDQIGKAVGYQDIGGEETAKRHDMARQYYLSREGINPMEELEKPIPVMGKGGITDGLTLAGEIPGQHEAVVPLPGGRSIPVTLTGGLPGEKRTTQLNQQIENLVNAVIKTPMANSSMISGPNTEFSSMMADNKPILSEKSEAQAQPQQTNQQSQEQIALMTAQNNKLDTLIRTMMSQTDISRKILQRQS